MIVDKLNVIKLNYINYVLLDIAFDAINIQYTLYKYLCGY